MSDYGSEESFDYSTYRQDLATHARWRQENEKELDDDETDVSSHTILYRLVGYLLGEGVPKHFSEVVMHRKFKGMHLRVIVLAYVLNRSLTGCKNVLQLASRMDVDRSTVYEHVSCLWRVFPFLSPRHKRINKSTTFEEIEAQLISKSQPAQAVRYHRTQELNLDAPTRQRLLLLCSSTGSSIPRFATFWTAKISHLSGEQLVELDRFVDALKSKGEAL